MLVALVQAPTSRLKVFVFWLRLESFWDFGTGGWVLPGRMQSVRWLSCHAQAGFHDRQVIRVPTYNVDLGIEETLASSSWITMSCQPNYYDCSLTNLGLFLCLSVLLGSRYSRNERPQGLSQCHLRDLPAWVGDAHATLHDIKCCKQRHLLLIPLVRFGSYRKASRKPPNR